MGGPLRIEPFKTTLTCGCWEIISTKEGLLLLLKSLISEILQYEGGKIVFKIIVCVTMFSLVMSSYPRELIVMS